MKTLKIIAKIPNINKNKCYGELGLYKSIKPNKTKSAFVREVIK